MRGVGSAFAAITIVNALPTGIGAAVGVALRARAEVALAAAASDSVRVRPPAGDTPLVREAVRAAVEPSVREHWSVEVQLESEIPPAVGLKSSSAVASAVVRAVAGALDRPLTAEAVARGAARAGRAAGVSATGAFDDALAGLRSGVVVTDNSTDRTIARWPVEPELGVALWIPPGAHPPSPGVTNRFRSFAPQSRAAADEVTAGRAWPAMRANGRLVDAAMGYDRQALTHRVDRLGAVSAGTSGLGPAFAVVAPKVRLPEIVRALEPEGGRVLSVDFASEELV